MENRKIKFKFCHFNRDNIRIKSSMLATGIILLFLGIQGIFNLVDGIDFKFLKLDIFSYSSLIIGTLLILSFIISCHIVGEYTPLINPNYQDV